MAFDLPKDILRELRRRFENTPHTLSNAETVIALRIRACERCEWIWIHRTRREPRRCPHCGTTAWNTPLIDLMRKAIRDRPNVGTPTAAPRPDEGGQK